ncbi:MAG: orotidine-5'-phosphate decarboxylase [Bacteroidales bacterium]|nr:orotidine-5'-phosphate decarboxylase [Bacteroidales bacterium]
MNSEQLFQQIRIKQSYLCVGLDPVREKLPAAVMSSDDHVFAFNKAIIDATAPYAVAFKPNTAFYETDGSLGWATLEKTVAYIRTKYPKMFVIADAKRGDIGNTSARYAAAFFNRLGADAVTVAPYMGADSVQPFLGFDGKWVVLLALTSNTGSADFQYIENKESLSLYKQVIQKATQWASPEQMMFVVGATHPDELGVIRQMAPEYFFLVPGVGAQGGDLDAVSNVGLNRRAGLLVNASRSILYASSGTDFAQKAAEEALMIQQQMKHQLELAKLI